MLQDNPLLQRKSNNWGHLSILYFGPKHYFSPFLQKEAINNVVKGFIIFEVQGPKNLPKK
jgi:hypothetical protein